VSIVLLSPSRSSRLCRPGTVAGSGSLGACVLSSSLLLEREEKRGHGYRVTLLPVLPRVLFSSDFVDSVWPKLTYW
jgi:hypothetical protein